MILSRFARLCLALLLLGLLAVSFYLHQRFPVILRQQATQSLQDYGVNDIEFTGLQLTPSRLKIDKLRLLGAYEGLVFDAKLSSLEVRYDWHTLISRHVQSVTLSGLDLVIEQKTSSADKDPIVLNVKSMLQDSIAQFPVETLQIKQWHLEYRPLGGPVWSAKGHFLVAGQVDLQFESAVAGGEIAVALRTSQRPPAMNIEIALRKGDTEVSMIAAQLQPGGGDEWEWHLQGELQHTPSLIWLRQLAVDTDLRPDFSSFEHLMLAGNSTFTAHVHHPNALNIPMATDWSALQPFDATIHIVNNIRKLHYPGTVEDFAGKLDTTTVCRGGQCQLTIAPFQLSGSFRTDQLRLPANMQRWLHWKETVPVHWESREPVKITASDEGKWHGVLQNTSLVLGDTDTQIRLEALQLDAILSIDNQLHLGTEFSTTIQTHLRRQQLPQLALTIKQQGNVEQNSFSMEISDTAESVKMDMAGTLNLVTGNGDGRLNVQSLDLPYFAEALITPLNKLELLQTGMEILSGSIELDTTFKRTDAARSNWTQQSHLTLHGLSGRVENYHFEKLALRANWSGMERWRTVQPVEFSLEKLDLGFEVHNIVASITLPKATAITKPSVRLEKFSAAMFGGQLFLQEPTLWDFGAPINTLTLRAQQWQLSDLVALQQDEDIEARGMLEGELPVTLDDGRIVIKKGELRALPPGGSIHYIRNDASRALSEKSTEVALALDLLSDFQYQVLSSTVDLDKTGNLQLGLSLAGHNPTLYEGRPVNFNINLEQNLDPLLQSLRLSDKLVKEVEKRLQ